jgi:phosphoglycerate dehydrogenase-like enzyme
MRMPDQANSPLAVAIAPRGATPELADAVHAGGGHLVPAGAAEALIWNGFRADELQATLEAAPQITWVQLPSAGIEQFTGLIGDGRTWTAAKGAYADPVAEHALALVLAGPHRLPQAARARTWTRTPGRNLQSGAVTILGGGGIAVRLTELLQPFHTRITVVRRHPRGMPGVDRMLAQAELAGALTDADAVILTLALTPETEGIIGAPELRLMKDDAWIVNVGRGKLIKTDDLVFALHNGWIGGAALDVTDPEPLPDGHPLWVMENCLITPHVANPPDQLHVRYAVMVRENIRRRIAGERLLGLVDPNLGY